MNLLISFILFFAKSLSFIFVIRPLRLMLGKGNVMILATAISLPSVAIYNLSLDLLPLNLLTNIGRFILTGVVIGIPFAIFLEALIASGRVIDFSRGAQFAEQLLPQMGVKVSQVESVILVLLGLFCFTYGGYQIPLYFFYLISFTKQTLELNVIFTQSLSAILLFCTPVLLISLLLDLFGGILSRTIGKLNVNYEIASIKMLLGVLIFTWVINNKMDAFEYLWAIINNFLQQQKN